MINVYITCFTTVSVVRFANVNHRLFVCFERKAPRSRARYLFQSFPTAELFTFGNDIGPHQVQTFPTKVRSPFVRKGGPELSRKKCRVGPPHRKYFTSAPPSILLPFSFFFLFLVERLVFLQAIRSQGKITSFRRATDSPPIATGTKLSSCLLWEEKFFRQVSRGGGGGKRGEGGIRVATRRRGVRKPARDTFYRGITRVTRDYWPLWAPWQMVHRIWRVAHDWGQISLPPSSPSDLPPPKGLNSILFFGPRRFPECRRCSTQTPLPTMLF